MFKNHKKLTAALTLALLMSVSTGFAKAPDFTVQIPYTGNGTPATPQQDYYLYMNAAWLKNAKIDPDKASKTSADDANLNIKKNLTEITQQAVKHHAADTATLDEKNIANMYACIQDQKTRNKAGLGNLAPMLKRIEGITNLQEYAETMANMNKHNLTISPMLGGYGVANDPIDNDDYVIVLLEPAGLSREMLEDKNNDAMFAKYRNHIRDLLQLYGRSPEAAAKSANDIFNLQRDLGLHSLTIAESANPSKVSNKLNLADLKKLYSNVNVTAMLDAGGIGPKSGIKNWYVSDPGLISRFNEFYTPEHLPVLKEYAVYSLLNSYSNLLGQDYQKLATAYEKSMSGAKKETDPVTQNLQLNQQLLPFTYGRIYANTYFDESRKNMVKSYVQLIMATYRNKLKQLNWMQPNTKKMALKKLDSMDINIGYPEAWQEYIDQLNIKSPQEGGNLINNVLSMSEQITKWERARVGMPVRKDLWGSMTPQDVDAFYNPLDNSINFPAGILQAPFFDAKASRDTNLGGVGMVIAHEITHCFDSNGAQYDEMGRQRNWWQSTDYAEFKKRQDKIAEYYSRYLLPNGTRMKGEQTLSENIADLGASSCITAIIGHNPEGLRQAYQNLGIIWRNKSTDQLLQAMLADIHALPYIRVDGVLSTTEGFYEAYRVNAGAPMYVAPEDRVRLW